MTVFNSDSDLRWIARQKERLRRRARHAAESPEQREARRADKREYDRRYYLEHRDEKLAKMRAYREINAMEISARNRSRITEEKRKAKRVRQRVAYAADPEKVRARKRAWHASNPGYARQADRDRRAHHKADFVSP